MCALFVNVLVQMFLDIACIILCFFLLCCVFLVYQCEFGFPIDCNLCLVGISKVLCWLLRLSSSFSCSYLDLLMCVGFCVVPHVT